VTVCASMLAPRIGGVTLSEVKVVPAGLPSQATQQATGFYHE